MTHPTTEQRELLELAAKAAGIEALYWNEGTEPYSRGPGIIHSDNCIWNPLADDGDALRLAVNLGLRIYTPDDDDRTAVVRDYAGLHVTEIGGDKNAATRRAIVRAAAAIAKGEK